MNSDEVAKLNGSMKFWHEQWKLLYEVKPSAWTPDMVETLRDAFAESIHDVKVLMARVDTGEQKFLDKAALEFMARLLGQNAEADGVYLAERAYEYAGDLLRECNSRVKS